MSAEHPPILWWWFGILVLRFPDQIDRLRTVSWPSIRDGTVEDGPALLVRVSAVAEATMTIVYIAAIAAVLLPHVRERIIENALGLSPADPDLRGRLSAAANVPVDLPVTLNAASSGESAITYPRGWRPQIGVFAPMVVALRGDPERSGFIVRHELGHARAGDHLLGGATGPLRPITQYAFPILLAVIVLTVFFPDSYSESRATSIVNAANAFTLVSSLVVALWLAELEADRYASEAGVPSADVFDGPRRLRKLLTHPPSWLRRRALYVWGSTPASALLLVIYPLTVAVRWFVLVATTVFAFSLVPDVTLSTAWDLISDGALWSARRSARDMIVFGALLIVWPWVGWLWRRLWGLAPGAERARFRPGNLVAGAVCICAAVAVRSLV